MVLIFMEKELIEKTILICSKSKRNWRVPFGRSPWSLLARCQIHLLDILSTGSEGDIIMILTFKSPLCFVFQAAPVAEVIYIFLNCITNGK